MKKKKKLTIGLALGGGGVRGVAHVGVLRELSKFMPIHVIAGTSMGAVVGGLYALEPDSAAIEKKVMSLLSVTPLREIEKFICGKSPVDEKKMIMQSLLSFVRKVYLFNLRIIKRWLFSGRELLPLFDELGLNTNFSSTRLPFCCVSADLYTGEEIVLREGNMKEAILASVALPGVFPPIKMGRRLLVDGGTVASVPARACRAMGADIVIGVGVEARVEYNKKIGDGLDIMFQADAIRQSALAELNMQFADIVIRPDVGHIGWAEFSRAKECIQAGARSALRMKPEILAYIRSRQTPNIWQRICARFAPAAAAEADTPGAGGKC